MPTDTPPPTVTVAVEGAPDAARVATCSPNLPARYHSAGVLGRGGMGEVWRVTDHTLARTVAMKLIRPELVDVPAARARFLTEARLTAGLQHPGIVAVHDQGQLADGRLWYTMREVRGETLQALMAHTPKRRLIEILAQVAQAVGYAHQRGIVHRDLKPSNVMVGQLGTILVLDWGLAQRTPASADGAVVGTRRFMSPEQGRGEAVTPAADVYALGMILHRIVFGAYPASPRPDSTPKTPLEVTCTRALQSRAADRHVDAVAFAMELGAWLDGTTRRLEAQVLLDVARQLVGPLSEAKRQARTLAREAEAVLGSLPVHAPVALKKPGWRLQEASQLKARQARMLEIELVQQARAALERDPALDAAHRLLADLYHEHAQAAEHRRDADAFAENIALLKAHERGRHAAWIEGLGRFSLRVNGANAQLRMRPIQSFDRRLEPVDPLHVGPAPWTNRRFPPGSYLVEVAVPGRAICTLPALIERLADWHHGPPHDADRALMVPTDPVPGACYIPAGWFISGGDALALDVLPRRRIWVEGLWMQRHPVTNADYIEFLNELHESDPARAQRHMPIEQGGVSDSERPMYHLEGGRFFPGTDAIGDAWGLDEPVVSIDWYSANAYAEWLSARTGRRWRLPHELEWEKAARGADGRFFPWGDVFEPTWTHALESSSGRPGRVAVTALSEDVSVYGVQGLTGNVRDWCSNPYLREAPIANSVLAVHDDPHDAFRAVRGGSMLSTEAFCRPATRFGAHPTQRRSSVGFRLVSSLECQLQGRS